MGMQRMWSPVVSTVLVLLWLTCASESKSPLPKIMRKELAKLDCSDGQLEALEMIATAQKEGRPETCYLSFMSGKKERRAVKKLCKQHLPKISVKKHEEGGSQCLILRVGGGSAEEGPAKSGMIFPVRALCTMSGTEIACVATKSHLVQRKGNQRAKIRRLPQARQRHWQVSRTLSYL